MIAALVLSARMLGHPLLRTLQMLSKLDLVPRILPPRWLDPTKQMSTAQLMAL